MAKLKFNSPVDNFDTAIEIFMGYCRSKGLSGITVEYYGQRLDNFKEFILSSDNLLKPNEITPQIIQQFMEHCCNKTSASMANHNLSVVKTFFRYLTSEGWIKNDPTLNITKAKTQRKVINAITPEVVLALVKTCKTNSFIDLRDKAILLVLFDCGIRVGELTNLTDSSINWEDQTMLVCGKTGERIVPFGITVKQVLTVYMARRGKLSSDRLFVTQFGDALHRFSIGDMLERRTKRAGITGVRVHAHAFRHGAAVELLRAGASAFHVQKLLGHQDLSMTQTYVSLAESDLKTVYQHCSPTDRLNVPIKGRKRLK